MWYKGQGQTLENLRDKGDLHNLPSFITRPLLTLRLRHDEAENIFTTIMFSTTNEETPKTKDRAIKSYCPLPTANTSV